MNSLEHLNYVADFNKENTNSRYKKSPVVATELFYVTGQLEQTNQPNKLWFNSSCLRACVQ
ncbi:hypothetical protein VbVaMValp1_28 [Vibrio phage Vb_VaM_Valp1]